MGCCMQCGTPFQPHLPGLGHAGWCPIGKKQQKLLKEGLSEYEKKHGYIIIFSYIGEPRSVPRDELKLWLRDGWFTEPPVRN